MDATSFVFKCPHCHGDIEAQQEWRGQVVECPYCGKGIVVPKAANGSQHPPRNKHPSVKVSCPWCGCDYEVGRSVLGQKVNCAACGKTFIAREMEKLNFDNQKQTRNLGQRTKSETSSYGLRVNAGGRVANWRARIIVLSFCAIICCVVVVLLGSLSKEDTDVLQSGQNKNENPSQKQPGGITRKEMSMDPSSPFYRGPNGVGPTNAEWRERMIKSQKEMIEGFEKEIVELCEFEKRLSDAGYYIFRREYDVSLVCVHITRNHGMCYGEIRKGLEFGSFSYPAWMSEGDARAIWKAYRLDPMTCKKNWENNTEDDFIMWNPDGSEHESDKSKLGPSKFSIDGMVYLELKK